MTASSWAGVVGAVAGLITAGAAVIGVLPALIKVLRRVDEVHKIVNQQHTDMLRYQAALVSALNVAGIEIPIDQSLPVVGPIVAESIE